MAGKPPVIVALLTDFGLTDGYVGSMKGVIRSIAPAAEIIDVSHLVEPGNIDQAAYLLWSVHRHYPQGTIFTCVVDPGVGTPRRILCARGDGLLYLAPDNGLLKFILSAHPNLSIVDVTNEKYFLRPVSRTFHGRDIFAPVAAHLARGLRASKLGPPVIPKVGGERFLRITSGTRLPAEGRILHIDHFGNIITNIMFPSGRRAFTVRIAGHSISRTSPTYGVAPAGTPVLIRGSSGMLEISVRNSSAARLLRTRPGSAVTLTAR